MMDIEKSVAKYSKNFHTVLVKGNFPNISKHIAAYRARLSEMYASESFRKHNIYPTTNTPYIYAVIAMCLELKGLGFTDKEMCQSLDH